MALLSSLLVPCSYECDTMIFEQGEAAHYLYFIEQGEVLVRYKTYDGPIINIGRVGAGEVVGWSAALGRETYTSGAVCTRDCQLLRIDGKSLRNVCKMHPESGAAIMDRFASLIAERVNPTHDQLLAILMQDPDEKLV